MGLGDLLRAAVPLAAGAVGGYREGEQQEGDRQAATERQGRLDRMREMLDQSTVDENNARADMYRSTANSDAVDWKQIIGADGQVHLTPVPRRVTRPGTEKTPGGNAGPGFEHDAPQKGQSIVDQIRAAVDPNAGGRGGDAEEGAADALETLPASPVARLRQAVTQQGGTGSPTAGKPPIVIGQPTDLTVPGKNPPRIDPNDPATIAAREAAKISTDSARAVNAQRAKIQLPTPRATPRPIFSATPEGQAKARADFITRTAGQLMKPTGGVLGEPSKFPTFEAAAAEAARRWDATHAKPAAGPTRPLSDDEMAEALDHGASSLEEARAYFAKKGKP